MKTERDDCREFRDECLYWQREFGLLHWELNFKFEEAAQGQEHEAECDFDCDTRYATITYYYNIEDAIHPADAACHEMQHLLYADLILCALHVRDANESDPALGREEHKVIIIMGKLLGRLRAGERKKATKPAGP